MEKVLNKINELVELGIIDKYALMGGFAQLYYIEPFATYDLDISISIKHQSLNPLADIFKWAEKNNYEIKNEHFIIEGNPVQFLIYNEGLEYEALTKAINVSLFNVNTHIFKAEYLMAIMIKVFRSKDKQRLIQFIEQAEYDNNLLNDILMRYNLLDKYNKFKESL